MLGVVANFKARPGAADALSELLSEVASLVSVNEPGNKLYQVLRSREDSDLFTVFELYESDEAFAQHEKAPHLADMPVRMGPLLGGRPEIRVLDAIR